MVESDGGLGEERVDFLGNVIEVEVLENLGEKRIIADEVTKNECLGVWGLGKGQKKRQLSCDRMQGILVRDGGWIRETGDELIYLDDRTQC